MNGWSLNSLSSFIVFITSQECWNKTTTQRKFYYQPAKFQIQHDQHCQIVQFPCPLCNLGCQSQDVPIRPCMLGCRSALASIHPSWRKIKSELKQKDITEMANLPLCTAIWELTTPSQRHERSFWDASLYYMNFKDWPCSNINLSSVYEIANNFSFRFQGRFSRKS